MGRARAVFDTERAKSTGVMNRLHAEKNTHHRSAGRVNTDTVNGFK
jgi:hypothetical protein